MSGAGELLERYLERARAAGVEAEVLGSEELPVRLEALVRGLGGCAVALPAAGWPPAFKEEAESAVKRAGGDVVSPATSGSGFVWDRGNLARAGLGITWCGAFLAETGSLVFPSGPGFGTLASLLPFVHLALSFAGGVLPDLGAWSASSPCLPSRLTLVTGPSRTGDIEGTMSTGVHGPGRVLHWILSERGP